MKAIKQSNGRALYVREVRGFIGMRSYYRRFVPNFSKIAQPLIDLTKKYARFRWTHQCQKSFDCLKESLSVVPLLVYPEPQKPYAMYTDAGDSRYKGGMRMGKR